MKYEVLIRALEWAAESGLIKYEENESTAKLFSPVEGGAIIVSFDDGTSETAKGNTQLVVSRKRLEMAQDGSPFKRFYLSAIKTLTFGFQDEITVDDLGEVDALVSIPSLRSSAPTERFEIKTLSLPEVEEGKVKGPSRRK